MFNFKNFDILKIDLIFKFFNPTIIEPKHVLKWVLEFRCEL